MNREHKYKDKDEYKDNDKDKDAKKITESLLVTGVTGVVRLTRGRYPPSDLECLSRQDSENIALC